ncbi:geranylgeranyl reductase family protein [Candidatus Latescibacterota bacterium]
MKNDTKKENKLENAAIPLTEPGDMDSFDMVVIGGGPAGSMAALTAADLRLSVLMVERDHIIGSPVRCAEGVDKKGISQFFTPDPKWIAAEITGYYLVAPDGTRVKMDIGLEHGYILERMLFDRMIAEKAANHGAAVMTGVDAVAMSELSDGFRTVHMKGTDSEWDVKARVVVAADGVESRAARWAGLKTSVTPYDMETCAQATCAAIDIDHHAFYMYFTGEFAPGGYVWVFPKGPHTANIGLGISGTYAKKKLPTEYLDDFLTNYFPGASVVSRTVGGIACTGGIKKMVADALMVCGDAAHMANPITGGGIINAMISGQFAGETAADALKKGRNDERSLAVYQKRCDSRFGKMNRWFYRVKEGILNIPNDRLNEIAHEISALPLEKRTPVRVLRSALIKNPKLLTVLAKLVF